MITTPGESAEPRPHAIKILLVDDSAGNKNVIHEAFTDTGDQVEVIKFLLGETLFTYLQQIDPSSFPNVIVLDHVSGTMSAFDILQQLKSDLKYARIPVIIHSNILSDALKEELLNDGAEEYTGTPTITKAVEKFLHQLEKKE